MARIIINADDFGLNANVNEAIVYCFRNNLISNTTVLSNMGCSSEAAVSISKEYDFKDKVGLHLNLQEGVPMTEKIKSIPLFCSRDGHFKGIHLPAVKKAMPAFILSKSEREALKEEIDAQLLWYLDHGFTEKHMDSHQSVHSWNVILDVVLPLFQKYGFKTMRKRVHRGGGVLVEAYEKAVNCRIPGSVIFLGDDYTTFKSVVGRAEKQVYELMTHPVFRDGKCVDDITGKEIKNTNLYDFELISYADL